VTDGAEALNTSAMHRHEKGKDMGFFRNYLAIEYPDY
jgi:hypothetical protein